MDDDIFYGKPTVEEIKEYSKSMNDKKRWSKSHLSESFSSPDSSQEYNLDDSFKTLIDSHYNTTKMENSKQHFILRNENEWDDSTIDDPAPMYTMSDDTFAELERVCDEKDKTKDEEVEAMHRLFKDAVDQTQLNDIEEPSGLWENTFSNTQKISPVKMCGLLRPSTIIEEESFLISSDYLSNCDTDSFKTAPIIKSSTKNLLDFSMNDETTYNSVSFKTANNHTTLSSSTASIQTSEKSNLIEFTPKKKSYYDYPKSLNENLTDQSNNTSDGYLSYKTSTDTNIHNAAILDKNESLIDNEGIIELSDDSFSYSSSKVINLNDNTLDELSSLPEDSLNIKKNYHPTINSVDSLEVESINDTSIIFDDVDDDDDDDGVCKLNSSHEFNDTLEKMEFMMNEGLKLMAAKKKSSDNEIDLITNDFNNTLDRTPDRNFINSPSTPATVIRKTFLKNATNSPDHFKLQKQHNYLPTNATTNINKIDKTPIEFKKPPMYPHHPSRIPQMRTVNNLKKNNFEHVVSPISMYIKKTPKTPLTASGSSKDIFNSKLCHIRDSNRFGNNVKENIEKNNSSSTCTLPMKAYFASDRNHIIDQRINTKIHGGDQMNRLLENKSSPTVTKHEGRIKLDNYSLHRNNEPKFIDDSFADLSIMSGDVSVQVINNAERF